MVDVSAKPDTARYAHAQARVRFRKGLLKGLLRSGGPKGPILEVARTAGVLAAKRTSDWIPLTHPLRLDWVDVDFSAPKADCLVIDCRAATTGPTGVEMEALVGAAAAALTIYDMTKSVDKGILIERLELVEKRGGKSGGWSRARRR